MDYRRGAQDFSAFYPHHRKSHRSRCPPTRPCRHRLAQSSTVYLSPEYRQIRQKLRVPSALTSTLAQTLNHGRASQKRRDNTSRCCAVDVSQSHIQHVRQPLKLQAHVLRLQVSGSNLRPESRAVCCTAKQKTHSHNIQLTFHSLVLCADVGMFQLCLPVLLTNANTMA